MRFCFTQLTMDLEPQTATLFLPPIPDDKIGKWNDPNPSTQTIARSADIENRDLQKFLNTSNIHNPIFHHDMAKAYKQASNLEYAKTDSLGDPNHEYAEFFLQSETSAENPYEADLGLNPIVNENKHEEKLRFSGNLYKAPTASMYDPPGTNKQYYLNSTVWDKTVPKQAQWGYLDSVLLPSSVSGGPLTQITQGTKNATDTKITPPKIRGYNDRTPTNDELRSISAHSHKNISTSSAMNHIYRTFK